MKFILLFISTVLLVSFVRSQGESNDTRIAPIMSSGACNLDCRIGTRCFRLGYKGPWTCEPYYPVCDLMCPLGQVCQLQQVTCIRYPCFPVKTCVPWRCDVCARVRCPSGTVCVASASGSGAICQVPF